jgi:hypothetical protein
MVVNTQSQTKALWVYRLLTGVKFVDLYRKETTVADPSEVPEMLGSSIFRPESGYWVSPGSEFVKTKHRFVSSNPF